MIEAPSVAVDTVLRRGAARVTQINATTRDEIQGIIATAVANDIPLAQLADALERGADLQPLIGRSGGVVGDLRYRSEMIARTEMMQAYNAATLASYGEAGIEHVIAIDGDGDEECAARNGQPFTREEADTIEDHPNGTLDWVPDFDSMKIGTQPEPDFTSGDIIAPEPLPETVAAPETPAAAATRLVNSATAAEPRVTSDIVGIGRRTGLNPNAAFTLDGKELHTLDARLKTLESTTRKIEGELKANPDLTLAQVERSMKDNLRYTYVADPARYDAAIKSATEELIARGYEPVRATNYWWEREGYAGLNTNWRTPDGQIFEVQFHTQSGLETKEVLSHPFYEAQRLLPEGSSKWNALQAKIDTLWRNYRDANPTLGDLSWLGEKYQQLKIEMPARLPGLERVPVVIDFAKTPPQAVADWFRTSGTSIAGQVFAKVPERNLTDGLKELQTLKVRMPDVQVSELRLMARSERFARSSGAIFNPETREIALSQQTWIDNAAAMYRASERGYTSMPYSPGYLVSHEYGHALQRYLVRDASLDIRKAFASWYDRNLLDVKVSDAISTYARRNGQEQFAEVFARAWGTQGKDTGKGSTVANSLWKFLKDQGIVR